MVDIPHSLGNTKRINMETVGCSCSFSQSAVVFIVSNPLQQRRFAGHHGGEPHVAEKEKWFASRSSFKPSRKGSWPQTWSIPNNGLWSTTVARASQYHPNGLCCGPPQPSPVYRSAMVGDQPSVMCGRTTGLGGGGVPVYYIYITVYTYFIYIYILHSLYSSSYTPPNMDSWIFLNPQIPA